VGAKRPLLPVSSDGAADGGTENLPFLETGGGEVAVGAKGPPILVLQDGMVVVGSQTS